MATRRMLKSRIMSRLLIAGIAIGMFTMGGRALFAQEVTGGITGTVTDPSRAAVPGATVTATDTARGTVWPTTTNSAGVYNLPRLPAGTYTIKATAKGFATTTKPAFVLQMNQVARVDFELKVGAVTQTVEVTGAPPLLQTETMQRGVVTRANFNVNWRLGRDPVPFVGHRREEHGERAAVPVPCRPNLDRPRCHALILAERMPPRRCRGHRRVLRSRASMGATATRSRTASASA